MNQRPGIVKHMMLWGFFSGLFLCITYIMLSLALSAGTLLPLIYLVTPFSWFMATIIGAVPGAIIGYVVSFPLRWQLKDLPIPVPQDALQKKRLPVFLTTFMMTAGLYGLNLWVFWREVILIVENIPLAFMSIVPAIIAAITATYSVRQYLLTLHDWSNLRYGRKAKRKNDDIHRLTENDHHPDTMSHESLYVEQKRLSS